MSENKKQNNSFLFNLSKLGKKSNKNEIDDIADEAKKLSIELQQSEADENQDGPDEQDGLQELMPLKELKIDPELMINFTNEESKTKLNLSTPKVEDYNNKTNEIQEQPKANQNPSTEVKVPAKVLIPIDAKVYVQISSDNMQAIITIASPVDGGKDVDEQMIDTALEISKIVYGIDEKARQNAITNKTYEERIVIAKGLQPIDGEDGTLEEAINISENNKGPKQRMDGTIDFKELGIIINIEKGQLICRITLPTNGINGKNVCGGEVPCRNGKPVPECVGRNTVLSEDKTMLVATSNGSVSINCGKYNVSELFKVEGNVDTSTGNINFLGSIVITGDVKEGFSVTATDEIKIMGMVEGAYLRAGSSVKIQNGVNGMGKGFIIANGDVKCKYIENCRIQAFGDVIAESIIGANIKCDGELIATGGKGVIMGGQYAIAKNVTAKIIGSQSNILTSFTLGMTVLLHEQVDDAKKQADVLLADIKKLVQAANYLSEIAKRNQLDSDKLALYNNAVYTHNEKIKELEKVNRQIVILEQQLNESTHSVVKAKSCIYPGVIISMSGFSTRIKSELLKPMIYLGDDGIVVSEGSGK
ncbi:MAG: FapA family protein [Oscillospiraceae bacterium]